VGTSHEELSSDFLLERAVDKRGLPGTATSQALLSCAGFLLAGFLALA
jgi:hypothetical protein